MTVAMVPEYIRELLDSDIEPAGSRPEVPLLGDLATAKRVAKHWGEERWLVAEDAPFGFKLIHVRAGYRLSLQYHEKKEEASLILRGTGTLYYAADKDSEIMERPIVPGETVHMRPGTVHRIAAITDLTLIEVSTPELDDVIRLADDHGRPDGRIESEHVGG